MDVRKDSAAEDLFALQAFLDDQLRAMESRSAGGGGGGGPGSSAGEESDDGGGSVASSSDAGGGGGDGDLPRVASEHDMKTALAVLQSAEGHQRLSAAARQALKEYRTGALSSKELLSLLASGDEDVLLLGDAGAGGGAGGGGGGGGDGRTESAAEAELSEQDKQAAKERDESLGRAFGEPWAARRARIRAQSPAGGRAGWDLAAVIVKSNDDVRQEVFALQLIRMCGDVWAAAGLPLWVRPYRILSTSSTTGLVEVIPDAVSFDSLKKVKAAAAACCARALPVAAPPLTPPPPLKNSAPPGSLSRRTSTRRTARAPPSASPPRSASCRRWRRA